MSAERGTAIARAIAGLTGDALLRFLTAQRWFGGKGGAPSNARVLDYVILPWGDGRFAIACVGVDVGGVAQVYQLPLGTGEGVDATAVVTPGLYDATRSDEFRRGLGEALARGATAESDRLRWIAEPIRDLTLSGESKVGSAEQSNTSIVFGDRAILKLFRLLKPGVQPDVEVTGFLTTRADFKNTPKLLATIRFEGAGGVGQVYRHSERLHGHPEGAHRQPERSEGSLREERDPSVASLPQDDTGATLPQDDRTPSRRQDRTGESASPDADAIIAGMLQDFLPSSTDAWSYALERGKAYFEAPIDRDPPNDFVGDARRLGAITRALHEALASDDDDPAFAPEAVTPEDVDRWAHRTQQSIRDSLAMLANQIDAGAFPADRLAEAKALVARRDHYLGWIDEIDDNIGDDLGLRTRVHGDYHLGQVLHTASNDFMIIDFEGEPSRAIDERREKTSPVRDVAGMLRSFAYAAATLAMDSKNIDPRTREIRIARWERDVRSAYLEGYLKSTDEDAPEILPSDDEHVRQLIALFEAEKAFYELAYELNNRPAWTWIPMRGISKLFLASR